MKPNFFPLDYLNEELNRKCPRGKSGRLLYDRPDPAELRGCVDAVDKTFKNSLAETLTETEKAFQMSLSP